MIRQWCAVAAVLGVVTGSASAVASPAPATAPLPRGTLTRVIRPGDPIAGPGGVSDREVRSSNWSGYAVTGSDGAFSGVAARWTEPAVTCTSRRSDRYASFWVGLDGYDSHSVEQTGTDSDCAGKTARYGGWYEMYPAGPVYFADPVRPGDHLSASVTFTGTDTYRLVLEDSTRGWTRTVTRHQPGLDRSSAEVITEAPSSGSGVVRLSDFGTVRYTAATVDGRLLNRWHLAKIVMTREGLPKDSTSAVSSAGAFHNSWIRSN
jgi:Peptidase A4 family